MTFNQKITYFFCSFLIYIGLALFDFFILKYIIDMFTTEWLIHTIIFFVLVLLVNPFLTLFILQKLPFEVKGIRNIKDLQREKVK